jgi:hypothetical protein
VILNCGSTSEISDMPCFNSSGTIVRLLFRSTGRISLTTQNIEVM